MTVSVPGASAASSTSALNIPRPDFPATAPAANPVFYRTYSRKTETGRESWHQVAERNLGGLTKLGNLSDAEVELMRRMQQQQKALP